MNYLPSSTFNIIYCKERSRLPLKMNITKFDGVFSTYLSLRQNRKRTYQRRQNVDYSTWRKGIFKNGLNSQENSILFNFSLFIFPSVGRIKWSQSISVRLSSFSFFPSFLFFPNLSSYNDPTKFLLRADYS